MRTKPVTIVGGGLAGLTFGIGLRQRGVPVTVWEAGRYPRHRVCGEFISGRGQQSLSRLGLRALLYRAGAIRADAAAFALTTSLTPPRRMPTSAICLSRFDLDRVLAEEFRRSGGELLEAKRWRDDACGEGIIRATGRKASIERNGCHWHGLKIHARDVTLAADLELHMSANGYVGLCRINDGAVNVCGLFRRPRARKPMQRGRDLLRGEPSSLLNERLAEAEFDESSYCAVAGLSLSPQRARGRNEACIGDAITMIPPMTGNGMSMAFESAEMAIEPVLAWSRGEIGWPEAQQMLARSCDEAFSRRLIWAKWLQRLALAPRAQGTLASLVTASTWLWRVIFEKTR